MELTSVAPTKIEAANWPFLLRGFHESTCVPFLGAAANIGGVGTPIPTGTQLAMALVSAITGVPANHPDELVELKFLRPEVEEYREMARLGLNDLARVSLHYRNLVGFRNFITDVRNRIIHEESGPSPLLELLARLPLELIVTTNYDHMMEMALGGRPCYVAVQPLQGFTEEEGALVNEDLTNFDGVRLYKLHGQFPPEVAAEGPGGENGDVSPVIITEEDYIQFLTVFREPVRGVPKWIEGRFRQSGFLFLGYGLEDWDFRTLYEGLVAPIPRYQKPVSYAIQKDPTEFWVRYWSARDVKIYNLDLKEFTEDLETRYVKEYGPFPDPAAGSDV